jgi:hypothetical protein
MEAMHNQHRDESLEGTSKTERDETVIPGIDVLEVLRKIADITGSKIVVLEDGADATQVYPAD